MCSVKIEDGGCGFDLTLVHGNGAERRQMELGPESQPSG